MQELGTEFSCKDLHLPVAATEADYHRVIKIWKQLKDTHITAANNKGAIEDSSFNILIVGVYISSNFMSPRIMGNLDFVFFNHNIDFLVFLETINLLLSNFLLVILVQHCLNSIN